MSYKYTADQLRQIEELAKLPGQSIKNMAIVLGLNYPDFYQDVMGSNEPAADAYQRGRLIQDAEFRKKVNQLSNQGSGPAQSLSLKLMNDAEIKDLRDYYG